MTATVYDPTTTRYARAIVASKRARWTIDEVLQGRSLDTKHKYLPDGLSLVQELPFVDATARRLLSQIQGRTYANIFGLVERFINAKVLEVSQAHWLGDQVALEALVRFSDEELKHQELFRRVESLAALSMPPGYRFLPRPDEVAQVVLGKSTWSVLALTCLIELFTQVHYKESIDPDPDLSVLFKDVFKYHWREESQHAVLDELEWTREDAKLDASSRDAAVDDLIALVAAVDGILQAQAQADSEYFLAVAGREFSDAERQRIAQTVLRAYRHQYIFSGLEKTRFTKILAGFISEAQNARIVQALGAL